MDYPLKATKRLVKALKPGKETGRAVVMSPDKYLEHAKRLPDTKEDKLLIDAFKGQIKKGRKLKPLKLLAHNRADGRHRAAAAEELGIKEVPVIDYRQSGIKDMKGIHSIGKKSKDKKVKEEVRKERAAGGPILPLGSDDPNEAFRRLISWSFATAPLWRHGAAEGGVQGDPITEAVETAKRLPEKREATLTAYEPTIGEKIYGAIAGLGSERPSPERRQFAKGVSELAGFTPGLGNVMAAEEAARAGGRGDYGEMALASLGALPAVGPAERKAAEIAENAIRAYHGSPHAFDKFDISKIGTGEGAQVYGHGLYFAQNEDVAKHYRDTLTDPDLLPLHFKGRPVDTVWNDEISDRWRDVVDKLPKNSEEDFQTVMGNLSQINDMSQLKHIRSNLDRKQNNILDKYILPEIGKPDLGEGHMYEVRLNAGPEHLLDWDKPLSDQHPKVQEYFGFNKPKMPEFKATETGHENPAWKYSVGDYPAAATEEQAIKNAINTFNSSLSSKGQTGEQIYKKLLRENESDAKLTADKLKDLGLRGIQYLDQSSRGAGSGSRNYVIFDPEHIETVRRYERGGDVEEGKIRAFFMHSPQKAKRHDSGSIVDHALDVISKHRK